MMILQFMLEWPQTSSRKDLLIESKKLYSLLHVTLVTTRKTKYFLLREQVHMYGIHLILQQSMASEYYERRGVQSKYFFFLADANRVSPRVAENLKHRQSKTQAFYPWLPLHKDLLKVNYIKIHTMTVTKICNCHWKSDPVKLVHPDPLVAQNDLNRPFFTMA